MIELLALEPGSPRLLLLRLGAAVAGIRTGPLGLLDLARGGRNPFPGSGMTTRFDDDSDGQARHFAGIATASARVSPAVTRWLSVHIGRDDPESPDGRLTDLAVAFARALLHGELATSDAAAWVEERLCAKD